MNPAPLHLDAGAHVRAFLAFVGLCRRTIPPPRPLEVKGVRNKDCAYRCVAGSLEGFVQQIATAYIPHGYWFYVQGWIPDCKHAEKVDAKLVERYGVAISKWARARRKRAGQACMQYIRYENTFLLLATAGQHAFFELERGAIRDVRHTPIKIDGYSVSARRGPDTRLHTHVRIDSKVSLELKEKFRYLAEHGSPGQLAREFYYLRFEPYAPIRRQYLSLLRMVNQIRASTNRSEIPSAVLPLRRRIVQPFAMRDTELSVPAA